MRLALESVDSVRWVAFPNLVGITGSVEGLNTTKRQKDGEIRNLLLFASCLPVWDGSSILSPWTGIYTIDSPGSQAFRMELYH